MTIYILLTMAHWFVQSRNEMEVSGLLSFPFDFSEVKSSLFMALSLVIAILYFFKDSWSEKYCVSVHC